VEKLPRQSRRIVGDPPEYTPCQLQNIKTEKSKSSETRTTTKTETFTILDFDVKGNEVNQPITSTILGLEVKKNEFHQNNNLTSHSVAIDLQISEFV